MSISRFHTRRHAPLLYLIPLFALATSAGYLLRSTSNPIPHKSTTTDSVVALGKRGDIPDCPVGQRPDIQNLDPDPPTLWFDSAATPNDDGGDISEIAITLKCRPTEDKTIRVYYVDPVNPAAPLLKPFEGTSVVEWDQSGAYRYKTLTFGPGVTRKIVKVKVVKAATANVSAVLYTSATDADAPSDSPGATRCNIRVLTGPLAGFGGGRNGQPIPVTLVPTNDMSATLQQDTFITVKVDTLNRLPGQTAAGPDARYVMVDCRPDFKDAMGRPDNEKIWQARSYLRPVNPDGTYGYWPYRLQVSGKQLYTSFKIVLVGNPYAPAPPAQPLPSPAKIELLAYTLDEDAVPGASPNASFLLKKR